MAAGDDTSPSAPPSPSSEPFTASSCANDGKLHLLLAASGSVATIKLPPLLTALSTHPNLSIRVILTTPASAFLTGQSAEQPSLATLAALPNVAAIYTDRDEWAAPWTRAAPILHIELRRWADLMVVAPLSANTLAKIANGMADGLLTSVVRAWDSDGRVDGPGRRGRKVIVVAPAMNVAMWRQPVTARQIRVLEEEWGVKKGGEKGAAEGEADAGGWFEVLTPIGKTLACGDVGLGAMVEWGTILRVIEERLGLAHSEQ